MMYRLLCLIGFHAPTYRERRDGIQHYVCSCCGKALTPVMVRTQDEHERVTKAGAVAQPRASVRQPANPTAAERARAKQVLGI